MNCRVGPNSKRGVGACPHIIFENNRKMHNNKNW